MSSRQARPADEAGERSYRGHAAGDFDKPGAIYNSTSRFLSLGERQHSMDLVNDPRFFNASVIEKRLLAFSGLSAVSSFVLGNCISQLYTLKKDFNMTDVIGFCQFSSFLIMSITAFSLVTATFVQTQQIFFTYRLLTAGPAGFEQASLFYLNRTVVMWRHFAMRWMMRGLILYMLGTGSIAGTKFYKDAHNYNVDSTNVPLVIPVLPGDNATFKAELKKLNIPTLKPPLDIHAHDMLGGIVFAGYCTCAGILMYIRYVHVKCFQVHYEFAYKLQSELTFPLRDMNVRGGKELDT